MAAYRPRMNCLGFLQSLRRVNVRLGIDHLVMVSAEKHEIVEAVPIFFGLNLIESWTSAASCVDVADLTGDGADALNYGQGTVRECAEIPGHREKDMASRSPQVS